MPLTVGTHVGPYEVLALLGAGGMGEVYWARDTRLGRDVAIKLVHPRFAADTEQLRRFEQEARAASQLDHPNILIVHDLGSNEGSPYIVSELLEGESLREKLGAPLPPRKAIEYVVQVAHGLAAAHEKGIVHRDLKPENLFVTKDGRVKILDFGIAKLTQPVVSSVPVTEALTASPPTEPGVVMGTVYYMSPEQVQGKAVDQRSDLFSLGVVLYELLSGRRPFQKETAAETMTAILREEPPELSQTNTAVSPGLERVVRHCLEKEPSSRFQSAADVAFALEALTSMSAPSLPAVAVPRERRARLTAATVTGAATLFLFAIALGFLLGGQKARPELPSFQQISWRLGNIRSARFAPDGRSVLYSASWEGKPTSIFLKQAESAEAAPLDLPSARLLAISAAGDLAIQLGEQDSEHVGVSRGTLARVPLTGGTPREVVENVQQADWGPNGALVVARDVGAKSRLEYPLGKVLFETVGHVSFPRLSPTGDLIAFIDHPHSGDDRGSIAVLDLQGRKKTLSGEFESVQGLAWSQTGAEVWFTAAEAGTNHQLRGVTLAGRQRAIARVPGNIRLEDVSRSGRALLTRIDTRYMVRWLEPGAKLERDLPLLFGLPALRDLSRDGRSIVFQEMGEPAGPNYAVCLIRPDSQPVRLGEGYGGLLSPDGKWITSVLPKVGSPVVLLPTGPGEPKIIDAGGILLSFLGAWLPDSKRLILLGDRKAAPGGLFLVSLDGETPRAISPPGVDFRIALSPDGRLVAAQGPDKRIWLYSVDGHESRPAAGAVKGDIPLQWSADGRLLYVQPQLSSSSSRIQVFRLSLDTGARALWKELSPGDVVAFITSGGRVCITPDGSSYAYSYGRSQSELYLADGLR